MTLQVSLYTTLSSFDIIYVRLNLNRSRLRSKFISWNLHRFPEKNATSTSLKNTTKKGPWQCLYFVYFIRQFEALFKSCKAKLDPAEMPVKIYIKRYVEKTCSVPFLHYENTPMKYREIF